MVMVRQDLLEPAPTGPGGKPGTSGKKLRLCEDVKKGVQVLGLEEVACTSPEEVMAVLKRGVTMRQVRHDTGRQAGSSRGSAL